MTAPTYTPTTWVNNTAPAISADNLNHIEQGIAANAAAFSGYVQVPASTDVATLYVTATGNDAHDGFTWKTAKATIAACQTAVASGPLTVMLGAGTLAAQTISVDRDGLSIIGQGKTQTMIPSTAAGPVVFNSAPATTRRNFVLRGVHFYLQTQPASAVGVQVDNFYRAKLDDVWIDQLAVNGTGLSIIGSSSKSTYYGTFQDVDVTSGGVCVSILDNCNGHEFFGGVLDGAGVAINIQPVTASAGECKWFGTKISTSNTRTANIGGGGALAQNHEFYGLRIETGVSASWVFSTGQGQHCSIIGGTFSGCSINPGAATDGNMIWIPSAGTFDLPQSGNLIVGSGGAVQLTINGNQIIQQGTAASASVGLEAKGTGALTVNDRANSGTGGLLVYDGAATPAVAFAVNASGILSGKKLGSNATVTGAKGGNAALASLLSALQAAGIIIDSTTT